MIDNLQNISSLLVQHINQYEYKETTRGLTAYMWQLLRIHKEPHTFTY